MSILFITYTRIGDAVLSTGLLSALIERNPSAAITVACGPAAAPLFEALPGLDRVLALPKQRFAGHWRALWRSCIGQRWDTLVDLRHSVMPYVLRARKRLILRVGSDDPRHKVDQLASVLDLAPPPSPRLWIDHGRRQTASELVPDGPPVLALGPCANWLGKQWPADRFADLARRLTDKHAPLGGARIAVFGAPEDREQATKVLDSLPQERRLDVVGRGDLLTVAACLEKARLYVGNDSGLMHIAAATGTPTLGLFGPSRDRHYAPWGAACAVVRTPESFEQLINVPGYDHRTTGSLMGSLTVDAVEAAANGLLRHQSVAAL